LCPRAASGCATRNVRSTKRVSAGCTDFFRPCRIVLDDLGQGRPRRLTACGLECSSARSCSGKPIPWLSGCTCQIERSQTMGQTLYDQIGRQYTSTRRPDPRIAAAICDALGDANSVVNVGAGTGAYEPVGRSLVAVEPSWRMIRQRLSSPSLVVQAPARRIRPLTRNSAPPEERMCSFVVYDRDAGRETGKRMAA
jgi:hypothetical protein